MNFIQSTVQALEVGRAQILARIVPLIAIVAVVAGTYDVLIFHGLNDAQSMDNAQLARQIFRHEGFNTAFLRPQAVAQMRDFFSDKILQKKPHELFPSDLYTAQVPRVLPDTYNAPGYPCLLAAWFFVTRPDFEQNSAAISAGSIFAPDRYIPFLNQIFLALTALMVFGLGRRLFDDRVAWMSLVAFLGTDLAWQYSVTALSTSFLMFLITAVLLCALEVCSVAEACLENDNRSFAPAWAWGLAAAVFLALACATRIHLLILLIPLFVLLTAMPRGSVLLFVFIAVIALGAVAPWFFHEYKVCGNPLGSNFPLFLAGTGNYLGNEIYCLTSIPSYELVMKDAGTKEISGFVWHLKHAWTMLGSNVLILLFGASVFHSFKQTKARLFHALLFGSALAMIAANNLGSAAPDDVSQWNVLVLLMPCMLVFGAAYFFILLDRLNLHVKLLSNVIIFVVMAVCVAPLIVTLTKPGGLPFPYPPYWPPAIRQLSQLSQPSEWITSDIPWATAWYGDRPSLWLPDSITDFQSLNDNVCPTGLLILTPASTALPLSNFLSGEYKDWLPFVSNQTIPASFSLTSHVSIPIFGDSYNVWSDRARWGN